MTLLVVVINGLLDITFCLFMPRKLYYEKRLLKFLSEAFAEREGFEPPVPLSTPVFKTGAFDHSAISP